MPPNGPPALIHERYRLSEWLGQGSLGPLYLARDELLDRPAAIRFFSGEARAVPRLEHPNILAVYEVGEQVGWRYLALEYVPGSDLRTLARQHGGKLPLAEALRVARAALSGLAFAHAQGVIHGDIRPEHIRVTPGGQVKLMDFGLGDDADARSLPYRAPECLAGQPPTPASDLYGLGALLYELVAGRPPFSGETPDTLARAIQYEPLEPPGRFASGLPSDVERLILSLLARDPALRCPAEQAAAALETSEIATGDASAEGSQRPGTGAPPETAIPLDRSPAAPPAGLEAERRRLARLLEARVVDPLNLLLAQAASYEQLFGAQPQARMALSVLASLARQALQQARDLEAFLHPAALESLGLEAALELLAEQSARGLGLTLALDIPRLPARLPPALELALFRLAQAALDALPGLYVTQASLRLKQQDDRLALEIEWKAAGDSAAAPLPASLLAELRSRAAAAGLQVEHGSGAQRASRLTIRASLHPALELTPREIDVLQGLVDGLSNKQIAARLSLSPRTVNFHLDHIYAKLGVRTRTEAALIASSRGMARSYPR